MSFAVDCRRKTRLTQQCGKSEAKCKDVSTLKAEGVTVSEAPAEDGAAKSGKDKEEKKEKEPFWRRASAFAESAATGGVNKPDKYGMYPI